LFFGVLFFAQRAKKRRATTNRSPNPNLKNYQNEKINLNVNRFNDLYENYEKSNPFGGGFFTKN
jgi:hypothetical protein